MAVKLGVRTQPKQSGIRAPAKYKMSPRDGRAVSRDMIGGTLCPET